MLVFWSDINDKFLCLTLLIKTYRFSWRALAAFLREKVSLFVPIFNFYHYKIILGVLNFVYVYILGSLSIVYKGKSRVQSGENVSTAISSHRYYCRLYIPTEHYHLPGIFIRTCVYNHFLAFFFVRILSRNQGSDWRLSFGSRGQCDVIGTLNAVTLDAFSRMPVEVFMHNFSCLWTNPFLYWICRGAADWKPFIYSG